MLFGTKCPECGTRNHKESMSCTQCGSTLAKKRIDQQLKVHAGQPPAQIKHSPAIDPIRVEVVGEAEEVEEVACPECGAVFAVSDDDEVNCPKCGCELEVYVEEE